MRRENENYSKELQNVISYMIDILPNEFATDIFTIECLTMSILDNKNSHANMILDNCLMSNDMEKLREIHMDFLTKRAKGVLNPKKGNDIAFGEDVELVLARAEAEKEATGADKIGTEHVLLAMLNPKYGDTPIKMAFNLMGIEYNFIFNKCKDTANDSPRNRARKVPQQTMPNVPQTPVDFKGFQPPVKSEVNTKAILLEDTNIKKFTINLNELAKQGKIDKLIGRKNEMKQLIRVLARRKKNNAVLVGDGGVGKTQIVYGLADMIENGDVPSVIRGKQLIMIDIMSIISGTQLRGTFEARVKGLFDELKASSNYILVLDDVQNVLKGGNRDKDTDMSGMIGDILSEGEVRVIATTTYKEYRNTIESNSSISRKLQKIVIETPSIAESIEIVNGAKCYYEEFHNVKYTESAIRKSVELANRYITDRKLPDSALDVIDLSGTYTCFQKEPDEIVRCRKRLKEIDSEESAALNRGDFEFIDELNNQKKELKRIITDFQRDGENSEPTIIDEGEIAETISEITGIPIAKLSSNEKKKIAEIDKVLKQSVIGQDEAINVICKVIKRNKVGLGDKTKTMGNFLMLGESGCGKSLIAKKLAEEIFGDEKALIRIDMSEYSEKNSVAKLTGAAPGYVGYENGGQLTERVKNKQHCVLLLDEIEKADQEVYNLFLQLFDEGRLTDSSGRLVNFKNVIVIMTSNIGARKAAELGGGVGFVTDENSNRRSIIEKELRQKFAPEFINRIDQIVYFNRLTDDNLRTIVGLEIDKLVKRINELGYNLTYDDTVVDFIHKKAIAEKEFGARPIIRLIQSNIEDNITDLLLENEYEKGHTFNATYVNNSLSFS